MFTYNEGLQRRLLSFAEQHPENCRFESQNNEGEMIFEIDKGRLSIRITAPYKEERRKASGERKIGARHHYRKMEKTKSTGV